MAYPSINIRNIDQQFAESQNEREARRRIQCAGPALLNAAKDALWVLDNISAIMSITKIESTLTDPRPALRAAIAKATGGES